MKFNSLSILFKLITFTAIILLLLMLLIPPAVYHTHTNTSDHNISTSITMTSNQLFILNHDDFKHELYDLYLLNEFPGIILSELHYDESYHVTLELTVYTNWFCKLLNSDPYVYIFQ